MIELLDISLSNVPAWAWLIIVPFALLALFLPLWMFIRIPFFRRMQRRAAAQGKPTLYGFWLLVALSYLVLIWVILWGYGVGR